MRFSQRIGIKPAQKLAQKDNIDEDLRNSLWNALTLFYWSTYQEPRREMMQRNDYVNGSNLADLILALWLHYFKKPIDTIETYWESCLREIRSYFFSAPWYEVYDFLEFIANNGLGTKKDKFINACNFNFKRENSAYCFVESKIIEITSKEEIEAIEEAILKSTPYSGVKAHLNAAIGLFASKQNPDYRNSIKESISAVESLAKHISDDDSATLGSVLKKLEQEKELHPALKKAFSSLYGYTSDADGIRHALMDEENLNKSDAKFMLICCSAFINYVIDLIS